MKYKSILWGALLPWLIAGCDNEDFSQQHTAQKTAVRFSTATLSGGQATDAETSLNDIRAYRFADGYLQETFGPMLPEADGHCYLNLSEAEGTLFFLANASQIAEADQLSPGTTTLEEFMTLSARTEDMTANGLVMSAQVEIDNDPTATLYAHLTRSMAKIVLESTDRGVEVLKVSIKNMAQEGYLTTQQMENYPVQTEKDQFEKSYNPPLENAETPLLYLCEQRNGGITVEVTARFKGALHKMEATLPAVIKRNTVYVLHVYGRGDNASIEVTADGWEYGSSADTEAQSKVRVNLDASALPEDVRVSDSRDTVFVPYQGSNFNLVLDSEPGTSVTINGYAAGTTVQALTVRELEPTARILVTSALRMPGSILEQVYLDFHKGQTHKGRVILMFMPNPIRLEGAIRLDENGICDFGGYIDGELGRLSLPEGKKASIEIEDGEAQWMKLAEDGNTYRILGGWKPNDPKADGRTQEARLVIANHDGSEQETYVIRRQNWGLPVVEVNGTWWCKYNLRGNVKDFSDQISIAEDSSSGELFINRLMSCSDDELLELIGGQYQGGNPDELPLRHDGTAFYHEGMKNASQNWGTMPPSQMAPAGYEIPSYDHYAFFGWGTNSNLGGVGTRTYRNAQGQSITVTITERDATFLGQHYGIIAFYDFEYEGNHWTLYGLGHQWDAAAGSIARMMQLLATAGSSSSTWYMEGYAQADRPGQNWFKYTAHNAYKTRTIRCVKTPVEYIYD